MTACTVAFDADELRRKVHDTYARVARAGERLHRPPHRRDLQLHRPTMAPA
jgi:hypothetical protein